MTTVSIPSRVMLRAEPQQVFDYVSDLTRHPEWSGGPLKVVGLSSGPVDVGSRYRSNGGRSQRLNNLQVTAYQPPTRFAFVATDAVMGDILHVFSFKAQDGGTLMERTVSASMSPITAILFRAFVYPLRGKPLMDKAMANLKARWHSEAG